MAVVDLRLLVILLPFHDAAFGIQLGRREAGAGGLDGFCEIRVGTEDARGLGGGFEQAAHDLHVVGGAPAQSQAGCARHFYIDKAFTYGSE